VVAAVVIMNIMLAVVTERTHEIGIRKSVGARKRDILNQFLVESSMLAASGGLIGVGIAWGLAVLVRTATPVPMAVPPTAVFIAGLPLGQRGPVLSASTGAQGAMLDPSKRCGWRMSRSEVFSAARMALATIREHKMRSFLTVLGVIIGTATVIAVGSIITGWIPPSQHLPELRSSTLIVFKFQIGFRFDVSREEFMRKPLTLETHAPSASAAPR